GIHRHANPGEAAGQRSFAARRVRRAGRGKSNSPRNSWCRIAEFAILSVCGDLQPEEAGSAALRASRSTSARSALWTGDHPERVYSDREIPDRKTSDGRRYAESVHANSAGPRPIAAGKQGSLRKLSAAAAGRECGAREEPRSGEGVSHSRANPH